MFGKEEVRLRRATTLFLPSPHQCGFRNSEDLAEKTNVSLPSHSSRSATVCGQRGTSTFFFRSMGRMEACLAEECHSSHSAPSVDYIRRDCIQRHPSGGPASRAQVCSFLSVSIAIFGNSVSLPSSQFLSDVLKSFAVFG